MRDVSLKAPASPPGLSFAVCASAAMSPGGRAALMRINIWIVLIALPDLCLGIVPRLEGPTSPPGHSFISSAASHCVGRTVRSSTDREPVRDASRICAAPLRAHGASTQQPPRASPHLAHARRRLARERCRPSFRQCTGWLGQDDCESWIERYRHSQLRKIQTPPRKVHLGEAQLWRGQARMCRGGEG